MGGRKDFVKWQWNELKGLHRLENQIKCSVSLWISHFISFFPFRLCFNR